MDNQPSDDSRELAAITRRWLARACSPDVVRSAVADGAGDAAWREPLQRGMVELGLTGLVFAGDHGGGGGRPEELGAALEEMGRVLCPGSFLPTVVLAGVAIALVADKDAAASLLPRIVDGEVSATLASGPDPRSTPFTAERSGEHWQVTGTAPAVLDATTADLVLAIAATPGGLGLFAIDGPQREALTAMDHTRPAGRVVCAGTPARALVDPSPTVAVRLVVAHAVSAALLAAEQLGGAARVLEMTVDYAKDRHQFGRAIGSFQAVKHRCADMLMAVESARSVVWRALVDLRDVFVPGAELDVDAIVLSAGLARALASETYLDAAAVSIQLHGGIGFTWEHDIHLHLKRARGSQLLLGGPVSTRARLLPLILADASRPVAPEAAMDTPPEVAEFLAEHPVGSMPDRELRERRYDAGLAVVHFEKGHGGLSWPVALQPAVEGAFMDAGAEDWTARNVIGLGMAMATIDVHGTTEQRDTHVRPCFSGEHIWCQLFSEPGAGSDLAGLSTRAVRDGDHFVVNGQKVWTSLGHVADFGLLLARTDPGVPKHRGLTYFLLDMTLPGIDVRPLRQLTGEAEFNEVHLTNVRVPASAVLGKVGDGWRVAMTTLMNERVAIGGGRSRRHGGPIAHAIGGYVAGVKAGTAGPVEADRLVRLWAGTEAARLTNERAASRVGEPGPEGSVAKLQMAEGNQAVFDYCVELAGPDGMFVDHYDQGESAASAVFGGSDVRKSWLRSLANSIEGGTSEVLRNVLGERVLGLPGEPRADRDLPWNEITRA